MPQEPNTLAWLIRTRMADSGWSYRDVATRAGLPFATVATLGRRTGHAEPPRPATIDKLSVGLGVSRQIVLACAADAAGFPVDMPDGYPDVRAYVNTWIVADRMTAMLPAVRAAFAATVVALHDTPNEDALTGT